MDDWCTSQKTILVCIIIYVHEVLLSRRAKNQVNGLKPPCKIRHDQLGLDVPKRLGKGEQITGEASAVFHATMCIFLTLEKFMYTLKIDKSTTVLM